MEYWRFQRQCLCADEVSYGNYNADIMILKENGYAHEIEIKCVKSDLCTLELRKQKHLDMTKPFYPNYFSFCVPEELLEEAEKIIKKLNPKYGLIVINPNLYPGICIIKSPSRLHDTLNIEKWKHKISYRLNSALIGYMKEKHKNV